MTSPHSASPLELWITQKLKTDWSSCEFGSLLTSEKFADSSSLYSQLSAPIKIRFLLSFLTTRSEFFEACKLGIVSFIAAAESDAEEWVRVIAGIVKRYRFASEPFGAKDTFLHDKLQETVGIIVHKIMETCEKTQHWGGAEQSAYQEYAYLNASVRPPIREEIVSHFRVVQEPSEESKEMEPREATTPRRAHIKVSLKGTSAAMRTPVHTPKAQFIPPPKENLSNVSSEIRRKADAGRFKRPRNRISMIDIDEVKQIVSEKAQKAEVRKRSKTTPREAQDPGSRKSSFGGAKRQPDKKDDGGGAIKQQAPDGSIARSQNMHHNPLTDILASDPSGDGVEYARYLEASQDGLGNASELGLHALSECPPQLLNMGQKPLENVTRFPPPPFGFEFGDYATQANGPSSTDRFP